MTIFVNIHEFKVLTNKDLLKALYECTSTRANNSEIEKNVNHTKICKVKVIQLHVGRYTC